MLKEECKKYFDEVVDILQNECSPQDLEEIKKRFAATKGIHKFENNYIYIITKDKLTKVDKCSSIIEETVHNDDNYTIYYPNQTNANFFKQYIYDKIIQRKLSLGV